MRTWCTSHQHGSNISIGTGSIASILRPVNAERGSGRYEGSLLTDILCSIAILDPCVKGLALTHLVRIRKKHGLLFNRFAKATRRKPGIALELAGKVTLVGKSGSHRDTRDRVFARGKPLHGPVQAKVACE